MTRMRTCLKVTSSRVLSCPFYELAAVQRRYVMSDDVDGVEEAGGEVGVAGDCHVVVAPA